MLIKSIGQASLQGGRDRNEDSILYTTLPNGWELALVCDGMGGLGNGKIASILALNKISAYCQTHCTHFAPVQLVEEAIKAAHEAVCHQAEEDDLRIGTTVALLLLTPDVACIAHLGDSRIYHLRNGKKIFRTFDHSKAFESVAAGHMTEEEARLDPTSNVLVKGLVSDRSDTPEVSTRTYRSGDLFFLCSDGVWNLCSEPVLIQQIMAEKNAERMVPWLLHQLDTIATEDGGGHDNLSAIALYTGKSAKRQLVPLKEYLNWVVILLVGTLISLAAIWHFWPQLPVINHSSEEVSPSEKEIIPATVQDSLDKAKLKLSTLEDSLNYYRQKRYSEEKAKEEKSQEKKNEKKTKPPFTKPQPQDSSSYKQSDRLKQESKQIPNGSQSRSDTTKQSSLF